MLRHNQAAFWALILACLPAAAAANAPTSRPSAATPDLTEIMKRLASKDFQTRETAQRELAKIPASQIDLLRAAAARETDAEVKSRLGAQVEKLHEWLATHPPAISIDITDATLPDVAASLNRALGQQAVTLHNTDTSDRFTLHENDASFAILLEKLNAQHPFGLILHNTVMIAPGQPRPAAVSEPFFIQVASLRPQAVDPQGNRTVALEVLAVTDPRIQIADGAIEITEVTGGTPDSVTILPEKPMLFRSERFLWSGGATLRIAAPVKQLASIKGTIQVKLVLESQRHIIDDVTANVGKAIPVPDATFFVDQFAPDRRGMHLSISARPGTRPPPSRIHFRLLDDRDNPLGDISVTANRQGGVGMILPAAPNNRYKAEIITPTRITTLRIPFELHNIPLP